MDEHTLLDDAPKRSSWPIELKIILSASAAASSIS
jgi:hypothetical protein